MAETLLNLLKPKMHVSENIIGQLYSPTVVNIRNAAV